MSHSQKVPEEAADQDTGGECAFGGCARPVVLEGGVLHRLRLLWTGT